VLRVRCLPPFGAGLLLRHPPSFPTRRSSDLVQSIPDALKLLLKEHITVKGADRVIYTLAPLISVVSALMIFSIIPFGPAVHIPRSEEHTSELQSRFDLVCRLLLEKTNIHPK